MLRRGWVQRCPDHALPGRVGQGQGSSWSSWDYSWDYSCCPLLLLLGEHQLVDVGLDLGGELRVVEPVVLAQDVDDLVRAQQPEVGLHVEILDEHLGEEVDDHLQAGRVVKLLLLQQRRDPAVHLAGRLLQRSAVLLHQTLDLDKRCH